MLVYNIKMSKGDKEVQATADDAVLSKLSAANKGYFNDPYLQYFVRKQAVRSPYVFLFSL